MDIKRIGYGHLKERNITDADALYAAKAMMHWVVFVFRMLGGMFVFVGLLTLIFIVGLFPLAIGVAIFYGADLLKKRGREAFLQYSQEMGLESV